MISLKNLVVSIAAIVLMVTIIDAQELEPKTAATAFSNPSLSEVKGSRLMQLSGVLKDPSGRPLSGVVGILTSLYKDPDGGTALWSETQNVQLDAQGNYSLLLGATTGEGIPLDILSSSEPRWLGVQALVPGNGEQPRFLLVSVPYALKAADADTLGGKPLSAFVLSDLDGKNGSSSPDGRKRSALGSTQDESLTSAITNPGTSGHFAKYVNSTDLGDAVSTEDSGGNIISGGSFTGAAHWLNGFGSALNSNGFAMSAPNTVIFATNAQESLKISSSGNITALGSFTGGAFWLNGFGSATNSNGVSMPAANQISLNTNGQKRLTIDSSGNIGIGTTTPTQKLDVVGGVQVTSSTGASIASLGPAAVASQYSGANGAGLTGYGSDPVNVNSGVLGASNSPVGFGGIFLNFKPTGTSLAALDSMFNQTFVVGANGKVGIAGNGIQGTTNLAQLTVKAKGTGGAVNGTGTVSVTSGSTTLAGSGTQFLSELAVGDRIVVTSTNQTFIISGIASDTSATITSSTGITTSGSTFTIQQAFFRLDDSGGTPRMVIQNRGNATPRLGIGTIGPADTLDVRGRIYTSSNVLIGPTNSINKRSLFTVKGIAQGTNSGTVSVSSSSTTVTGTNTFFLTQVGLGDRIQIGAPVSETRTVVDITDDLTLTVDSPFSTTASAVTSTTVPALIRADDVSGTPKFIVNDLGNIGIGTLLPKRELEVNGGMRLNTINAKPACDATSRGTFWVTPGGTGVKDSVEVCAKDASDLYAWRTLY